MNNLSKSNESYYQKIKANQKKLIIFLADQIGHSNLHCVQLYSSFYLIRSIKKMGHDNLSMFKNLLKYRHESKKQVCDSFTYFRGQI